MTLINEVLELEHHVWRSVIAKDGDAMSGIFSDDYVEVTADGQRVLKDSVVENSPKVDDIDSYAIADPTVVQPSPGSAILSYRLTLIGKLRGEPITPTTRWVASVWRRTNAGWKCCFFQQTGTSD